MSVIIEGKEYVPVKEEEQKQMVFDDHAIVVGDKVVAEVGAHADTKHMLYVCRQFEVKIRKLRNNTYIEFVPI